MIIELLVKVLPMIVSNISPVFTAKLLPWLDYPVDFNKEIKGKRVFGSHKTWRGVATMMITGALIGKYTIGIHYGLLVGVGVVIGDLITSLLKRRMNLKPGQSFQPYESLLLVLTVTAITWDLFNMIEVIIITLLSLPAYKLFHYLGYWLRLKTNPW